MLDAGSANYNDYHESGNFDGHTARYDQHEYHCVDFDQVDYRNDDEAVYSDTAWHHQDDDNRLDVTAANDDDDDDPLLINLHSADDSDVNDHLCYDICSDYDADQRNNGDAEPDGHGHYYSYPISLSDIDFYCYRDGIRHSDHHGDSQLLHHFDADETCSPEWQ